MSTHFGVFFSLAILASATVTSSAVPSRTLTGHVPAVVARLQPTQPLPSTNQLRLVIGLPLRNQNELDALIAALHDPASPQYRQWITPDEFTRRFGPTEADYQKVVSFAQDSGMQVVGKSANRMIIDVVSSVPHIQKAFNLTINEYAHPTENRKFFAPNVEPTVAADLPILLISGLDNYQLPYRKSGPVKLTTNATPHLTASGPGSGPSGLFMGRDFRNAYVPGVTNTGVGQYIAICDVGGPYYAKDVYMYQTNAGLSTNIGLTNIILSGGTGVPSGTNVDEGEQVLDITMAMSMAPGAVILNYEGEGHDVFNQIAIDNKAKQATLSYGFGIDSLIVQMFQQFLAQGQALCSASGDSGARKDGVTGIDSSPYLVQVGGSSLNTASAGGPWSSEVVWGGTCGGIAGYGIPTWQQGMDFTLCGGSTSFRNYPDVVMPGDNIFTVYKNGGAIGGTGGASASAPLFAGFLALANQEAEAQGKPSVGFPLPAIYAVGKSTYTNYTKYFHDITSGNNFSSDSPMLYTAVKGYDLCSGWGSPTGSNTIQAIIGWGTNDFMFEPSQASFDVLAGTTSYATITPALLNGLTGTVSYSIDGLPAGIAATHPTGSGSQAQFSVTVSSNMAPGVYSGTLTGSIGSLSKTVALSVTVREPLPGSAPVSMTYNRIGLVTDGHTFSGGFDNGGYAYPASLIGTRVSWNGVIFTLGNPNVNNVASCNGQVITSATTSQYSSLLLLGAAANGSQTAQSLVIKYSDGTTTTVTQSFSDWANSQRYANESIAASLGYRTHSDGSSDSLQINIYAYNIPLDPTRTFRSITLPRNANVILMAVELANTPEPVSLASFFNRAGIYTDSTTFTNPATGGLDGGGSALSATALGGSLTWSNTIFTLGTANATNVISTLGQTIPLPVGNYAAVRILATAYNGNQPSQTFTVKYGDGTSTNYTRGVSDWYSPQNYFGESKAAPTGHRNNADGTKDGRTFYVYGYSLPLDVSKNAATLKLPNNANVIVLAVSLVPNWPPVFFATPFIAPAAVAGQTYSATAATNVADLNGNTVTFSKVSGPAWLAVSSAGLLSGRPLSADVGDNSFVLSIADASGVATTTTMTVTVAPAAPIQLTITPSATNTLILSWTGGAGTFQVLATTNLAATPWTVFGDATTTRSIILSPTNTAVFYKVTGQ